MTARARRVTDPITASLRAAGAEPPARSRRPLAELASRYGAKFDDLADRWAVLEAEHDKQHPDRGECGGVGACSMMFGAVTLRDEMMGALEDWRTGEGR